MNAPGMPSRPWSRSVCHHSSYGTFTMVAPSRATASSFVCGALSGITTVHGTPSSRAPHGVNAQRFGVDVRRRREIFDREAERLEQRDLLIVAPAFAAADEQLADLGDDVLGADFAVVQRDQDVARLFQCGLTPVDIQA